MKFLKCKKCQETLLKIPFILLKFYHAELTITTALGLNLSLQKSDSRVYERVTIAYAPKPPQNWAKISKGINFVRPPNNAAKIK